jgi:hypothetical protein
MPVIHLDERERRWLLRLAIDREIAWLAVKLQLEANSYKDLPITYWQGELQLEDDA